MSDPTAAALASLNKTVQALTAEVAGLKEVATQALDQLERLAETEGGHPHGTAGAAPKVPTRRVQR